MTEGGAGLASLAVEREVEKVCHYLRSHVEVLFIIGSYCNNDGDDTLAKVLKHQTGQTTTDNTIQKATKLTKLKGLKKWKNLNLTQIQAWLAAIEPEVFTPACFETARADIKTPKDRLALFLEKFWTI